MGLLSVAVGRSLPARLARGGVVLGLAAAFHAPGWAGSSVPVLAFWNRGLSAPAGLYVYAHAAPARRGEMVAVRNPPRFRLHWLLKRVEGVQGDRFCWDEVSGAHRLNGRLMPPPDPVALDIGVPVWRGCATLGPGELVGYGRGVESYDSRYFGPVREADLWGVYAPLWVGG